MPALKNIFAYKGTVFGGIENCLKNCIKHSIHKTIKTSITLSRALVTFAQIKMRNVTDLFSRKFSQSLDAEIHRLAPPQNYHGASI